MLREFLKQSTKDLGLEIDDTQIEKFLLYKDLLIHWNEKINLTAITEPKEIVIKHFIDSLTVSLFMEKNKNNVIDIGTGAGFPAIPLKIFNPELNITLVDSTNKKINFLKEVGKQLELANINYIHGRAEEMGNDKKYREKFDYCVSRAVANLRILSELCLPFVKKGGDFIALKGPAVFDEKKEAEATISKLGGKIFDIKTITLPNSEINHYLVIVNKLFYTPTQYPRIMSKISKIPIN